jgi:VanZ family protein
MDEQAHNKRRISMAWWFAGLYVLLVIYASLHPFIGWRLQGIVPWAFLLAPWPQYWTGFDVLINLAGYAPLGWLLTIAMGRTGSGRWAWASVIVASALSLLMEMLQTLMVLRVPSQVDWLLNTAGAALGMLLGLLMLRMGWLQPWTRFRESALARQNGLGFMLIVTWPVAMLYPTSVPFGLGHVWGRLEVFVHRLTQDSFVAHWQPLSLPQVPLSPLSEAVVVALCVWAPLLLGFSLLRGISLRARFLVVAAPVVVLSMSLTTGLTYGPVHAWAWLTPSVVLGLLMAGGLTLLSLKLSHRSAAVLSLLAWAFALGLINQSPEVAYFAQSLQQWEQGRFIHFHGLSKWVGWLWPYAAMGVALHRVIRTEPALYNSSH